MMKPANTFEIKTEASVESVFNVFLFRFKPKKREIRILGTSGTKSNKSLKMIFLKTQNSDRDDRPTRNILSARLPFF